MPRTGAGRLDGSSHSMTLASPSRVTVTSTRSLALRMAVAVRESGPLVCDAGGGVVVVVVEVVVVFESRYVKASSFVASCDPTVTTTSTAPAAWGGVVARMDVLFRNWTEVALVAPN